MHGVTAALLGFQLLCLAFPRLVRHKPQYYWSVGLLVLVILLDAIARIFHQTPALLVVIYFLIALLQIGTIALLLMSTGGLSPGELADELKNAYEVMRRGEEEKEVIVPLSGQRPPPRGEKATAEEESPAIVYRIDDPAPPAGPLPVEEEKPKDA